MTIRYIIIVEKRLKPAIKGNTDEKFKRLFCIVCMLVLSLAACGKQDTDDGVKKIL